MKYSISLARAKKTAAAWDEATSLSDAIKRSGYSNQDARNNNRVRRATEEMLGIKLTAHNDKNSTHDEIECPSTLDIRAARKCKDFVITSLTNNSPLIKPFLFALKKFIEARNGQLLVIPVRYQNPNAVHSTKGYFWDDTIYPYALTKDLNLGRNLVVSAVRLNATSVNPLSGKQALGGQKSVIYGHPQLAMELVGTPKDETPKVMMTTGSCNKARYSSSDRGGKAYFYHTAYAVYVKRVGSKFHHTQLGWDGSGFHYLDEYWTEDGVSEGHADIVHGDSHVSHEMPKITQSKLRLLDKIKPVTQVWHDLHNQEIGSHHATLRERIEQALIGKVSVEKEVRLSIDYIERLGLGTENLIVGSNHNDHLDQWYAKYRPERDPYNAKFHGWLGYKMLGTGNAALETCFEEWGCTVHYKFLSRNTRHSLHGNDISQHGDKGQNGSRGSAKGLAKTQNKTIIGHSHTPCIEKGCWQMGTSTDRMEYAQGYSTWMITDCLVYPNGKRALINHIDGKTLADY